MEGFAYVAIWTTTGERQAQRIKEKFVHSALRQDAEWFDTNNRDELPTSIANAMIHISASVGRPMADLFANGVSSAACLAVAMMLNTPLALTMLCVVPIVSILIALISCFSRKASRQGAAEFVAAGALATEVISGIKTVASLCAEQWALTTYSKHIQRAQKHAIYGGFLTGLMSGLTGLLFYLAYMVAFSIGTEQVSNDMRLTVIITCFFSDDPNCRVSGASVVCCIYGVILSATFFGLMAPGLQNINLGRQAAATIFSTINRIPVIDVDSNFGSTLENKLQGEIVFTRVFFAYPTQPNRPIFYDFNLQIKAGTSVAFVGPSGSGKSTIAKLLLRFYCPMSGNILVDGHPLGALRLSWWRKQIGYVAQSPILFPGTIGYNIGCGLGDDATKEQIVEAAKAACAHEFIMDLPDGYETYYSGASIQLSGGQMQRICIARAMIRKPAVLLLDEATSALDTNSERQVQDALANIRKVKQVTTITVAHRLSTIVSCDKIAVISDGSIAELGCHDELIRKGGIYTTLCASQGITPDSTFEQTPAQELQVGPDATMTLTSKEDFEVSFTGGDNTINATASKDIPTDIEKGGIRESAITEGSMEEDEDLENLYASQWRVYWLNRGEWGYMFVGLIGSFLAGAVAPCESIFTARIVQNFYTVPAEELMEENAEEIAAFGLLGCISLVGNLLSGCGFSVSGYRLSGRLRRLVFEAMIRRNIGWFDTPDHSVGELTTRLEADAEEVAKITGWALGYKIRMFSSLIVGVVIAVYFSWQVGLTAICCVPLIMASSLAQKCCLATQGSRNQQDGLSPESIFENGLRGIDAIQSYGLQGVVANNYSDALIPQSKKHTKMGVTAGLVYGLSQFATFGSFAIIFFVGIELVTSQKVTFLEFFTPLLAIMFGTLGIASINADFNAQQDGLKAAQRIFNIIDEPLDEMDPFSSEGIQPESLNGAITYKNCSFAYPTRPNAPVYYPSEKNNQNAFSLSIEPKQSVAFVGKSGSGKSTALQILLRYYNISEGEVLLDGTNLEEISIPWLRRQIGYVGQNPTLFAGTIRSNILLGKPDATQQEIEAAAKAAAAHDFIMQQTDGYDTDIGNGGSLLSGGQRQRVAIARAIVADPKMLVLDEATAALDNVSEGIVQEALDEMQRKQPRTTLVVAHRLTTVKDCDQIAVLGNGGVLELGRHSELLDQNDSLYKELWEKQGA